MRKSFTRFLGLLALFMVLGFQVCLAGVKTLVPKNGELNAVKTTDLTLTFDYPLSKGSAFDGAAIQLKKSDGTLVDQINTSDAARFVFSEDKKTITLDIQASLEEGTTYYVYFGSAIVKENKTDGTTSDFAGYNGTWSFKVGDHSSPVLASSANYASTTLGSLSYTPAKPFYPVKGQTDVGSAVSSSADAFTSKFYLSFNEKVKGNVGYIKIYEKATGIIHELIDASKVTTVSGTDDKLVSFESNKLRPSTEYYILIDAGAFIDKSENKNEFAGISDATAWSFKTRSVAGPDVTVSLVGNTVSETGFKVSASMSLKGLLNYTVTSTETDSPVYGNTATYTTSTDAQTLTISTLSASTKYYFYYQAVASSALRYFDLESNTKKADAPGVVTEGKIEVTTIDTTNPVLWGRYPANAASNVPSDLSGSDNGPTIKLYFSEKVKPATGNVIIYNAANNTVFETIDVTDKTKVDFATEAADVSGITTPTWTVSVKPTGKLASTADYYIKIAKGVIVDASGNKYAGFTLNTDWTFKAKDSVAPVVAWSVPSATDKGLIQKDATVTITFNETLSSTVTASSFVVEKDNVVQSDFNVSVGSNTVTITGTATNTWAENSTYTIKILANTVCDASGNYITKELKKTYNTDSWVAPTSSFATTPGNISSNKSIKITFSENIVLLDGTAITNDNIASLITVRENSGPAVDFTATWNYEDGYYALITPASAWVDGKSYTVSLSNEYKDKNLKGGAKQTQEGIKTASYTVKDTTSPSVTFEFKPLASNVYVSNPDIAIKFSETLTSTTSLTDVKNAVILRVGSATGEVVNTTVSVVAGTSSKTYKVTPSSLLPGTTYYLAVADKALSDASGNKNVGNSTTFVTGSAPQVVAVTPASEATNVALNTNSISLQFNEAVKTGSPTTTDVLQLYSWDSLNSTWVVAVNQVTKLSEVTFISNYATFLIHGTLSETTKYSFSVVAGAAQDVDGNGIDEIKPGDFYFTTKDVTSPVASFDFPASVTNTTTDANMSKAFTITFNEKIKRGSGIITISGYTTSNTTVAPVSAQAIDVNGTLVSINNDQNVVSVNHNLFVPGYTYVVDYNQGTFTDLSGNKAATVSATFTAHDNQGPNFVASQSLPLDGSDKNAVTSDLVIKFDESVVVANSNARITLYKETSTSGTYVLAQSYKLNETNVTVSGNTINVALVDLYDNSHYAVILEGGAVSDVVTGSNTNDVVGGTFASSSWAPEWSFFTGDHNGPVASFSVNGTVKDGNMIKVDRTSDIVITFDEAIQHYGGVAVSSSNIADYSNSVSAVATGKLVRLVPGTFTGTTTTEGIYFEASIDNAKKVITIPSATINNVYTGSTDQGFTLIVGNTYDLKGNAGEVQYYNFKIDDYTAPTSTSTVVENVKGTEVVVSFKANEKAVAYYQLLARGASAPSAASVKANGTSFELTEANKSYNVTIPTTAATKYDLYIVYQDVVRNTLQSAPVKIAIRTADITAPLVTEYGNNGKTIDTLTPTFKVTFDSDLNTSTVTGNVYIFNAANNALVTTIAGATVTNTSDSKPRILQFSVSGGLQANNSYYINIDKGIVVEPDTTLPDENVGTTTKTVNGYAGLFDATTYTFKTKDTENPYVANLLPYGNTQTGTIDNPKVTQILPEENLVITFNEEVVAKNIGVGDIVISQVVSLTSTETPVTKEVVLLTNSATANLSGKVLTINPVMNLVGSATYQVEIKAGLVKDASGNSNGLTRYRFEVKDVVSPTVTFTTGIGSSVLLTKAPNLLDIKPAIKFNEKVYLLDGSDLEKADVDSLVSLTDVNGAKLAFSATLINRDSQSPMWQISPAKLFKSNSTYTLSFGKIVMDEAGNAVEAQSVTFTTKLTDSPDVIITPLNASKDVDKDANITISLSRGIVQGDPTGSVALGYFSPLENSELKDYVHLGTTKTNNDVAFKATISSDKKLITIDPVISLNSGTKYYLTFNPLGFGSTTDTSVSDGVQGSKSDLVDEYNNDVKVPVSITNGSTTTPTNQVEFTVLDFVAPELVSLSPEKKDYLLSDKKLKLEFDEEVVPGTGDVKIYRKDGTLAETVPASALTIDADDAKILYINPASARENNMEYYVIVPAGAIVDKAGNGFAGLLDNTKWVYQTTDNQNPSYVTLAPAKATTGVGLYDNLYIYFDKDIALGNGIISIYKKDGSAFDLIRVEDGEKAVVDPVDGKKLIINFARVLDQNSEYFVKIEAGAVVNKLNDKAKFAGINDATSWTFSTESTTAPKYLSLLPVDDATNVSIGDLLTLKITFDMNVLKGEGTVRVVNTVSGALVEAVDVAKATISGAEVSVPMSVKLSADTRYHVFVDAGAFINTLPSKVGFAGINAYDVWNFTTAPDVTAPTLTVTAPVAPIAKVFTVGLTFSEPVTGVASGVAVTNGTAVVSGSGAQYSITVTSEEQKNVTIVLANTITDLAKTPNAFAGQTLSYTTGDFTAPALVSSTPTGALTDNHPTFVVTFAENVAVGSGSLNIYKKSDGTLALSIPVTAGMISGKVATVTYTYDAAKKNGLDQNTDYYVLVDKGFVKDVAGNEFAGVTASTTWTFKTGGFVTPVEPGVNNSLEFKVYPNPFVDYVTVSNASELSKVVVSNIAGQVVKEVVYPDGTIQLNELRSGIYFITLYKDNEVVSTVKLLKR